MDGLEEREWELDGLRLASCLVAGGLAASTCTMALWLEWEEVESALLECLRFALFFMWAGRFSRAGIQPDTKSTQGLGHFCWTAHKAQHPLVLVAGLLMPQHQLPAMAPATR